MLVHTYNSLKSSVDIFDELLQDVGYFPTTFKWPQRVFQFMIAAASVNSYLLMKKTCSRRSHNMALAKQLISVQRSRRSISEHYIPRFIHHWYINWENIEEKARGQRLSSKLHCYKCNKSGAYLNSIEKCGGICGGRYVCDRHSYEVGSMDTDCWHTYCEAMHALEENNTEPRRKPTRQTDTHLTTSRICHNCHQKKSHLLCNLCFEPTCKDCRSKEDPLKCVNCIEIQHK